MSGGRAALFSVKVENISMSSTQDSLREHFGKFGAIGDVHIPKDHATNQSRGFAFVRYVERGSIDEAIKALSGRDVDGSVVSVVEAGERRNDRDDRSGGASNACFDFQKGTCTRGDSCRFSHGGGGAGGGRGGDPYSGGGGGRGGDPYRGGSADRGRDSYEIRDRRGNDRYDDLPRGRDSYDDRDRRGNDRYDDRGRGDRFDDRDRRGNDRYDDPPRGGGGDGRDRCFDFSKGLCSRGDSCRFSHDPNAASRGGASGGGGGGGPCYDFQKGQCSRGDSCRFSHAPGGGGDFQAQRSSRGPCYQFQKGECTRGDLCRFTHEGGGGGGDAPRGRFDGGDSKSRDRSHSR